VKMPRIPNGLLERCLETIPATTVVRQRPQRPYLDNRSRWLLTGLSLTAAIPVITVLAILPLRNRNNTYHSQQIQNLSTSIQFEKKLNYVRVESWRRELLLPQSVSNILPFTSEQRLLEIMDRKRGICYLVKRDTDRDKRAIDGKMSQMVLPDGEQFFVSNTTLGRTHWGKGANWDAFFDVSISQMHTESGPDFFVDTTYAYTPLLRYSGTWKATPVQIELYFYKPKHTIIDLTVNGSKISSIRVERYISQATGRVIAERRFLDCQPGKITDADTAHREMQDQRDILYREDEYFYQPLPGEEQYFDPMRFLKAAKPASP